MTRAFENFQLALALCYHEVFGREWAQNIAPSSRVICKIAFFTFLAMPCALANSKLNRIEEANVNWLSLAPMHVFEVFR